MTIIRIAVVCACVDNRLSPGQGTGMVSRGEVRLELSTIQA